MIILTVILIIFSLILLAIIFFLGREYLKKFKYMQKFINNSNQLIKWNYSGNIDGKVGMRNIVLRGDKPFSVLVGFELGIPILHYSGFDYYGFVKSDDNNIAIFSTYLGKNPCGFQLFVNTDLDDNKIKVSSNIDDQNIKPQDTFYPHWFQRIGFYG